MTSTMVPTRSRTRAAVRNQVRALLACVGVLVLVVTLIGNTVTRTTAAWTDEEYATSTFTAGELGPVPQQSFECHDEESLLELGLLKNQLLLNWEEPSGIPEGTPIEYEVTWDDGLLGGSGTDTVTESRFLYETQLSLLSVGVRFTVTPRIESWEGTTLVYRAALVALVVPIRIACDKIIGIL